MRQSVTKLFRVAVIFFCLSILRKLPTQKHYDGSHFFNGTKIFLEALPSACIKSTVERITAQVFSVDKQVSKSQIVSQVGAAVWKLLLSDFSKMSTENTFSLEWVAFHCCLREKASNCTNDWAKSMLICVSAFLLFSVNGAKFLFLGRTLEQILQLHCILDKSFFALEFRQSAHWTLSREKES